MNKWRLSVLQLRVQIRGAARRRGESYDTENRLRRPELLQPYERRPGNVTVRGRHKFVAEHFGRSQRPEEHAAGAQALSVFDQRVAVAVRVRHAGLEGVDGVERVAHELHRRLSAPLLRGHRAVRQARGGGGTVRS